MINVKKCNNCQRDVDKSKSFLVYKNITFCHNCSNNEIVQKFFENKIRNANSNKDKQMYTIAAYELYYKVNQCKSKSIKHPYVEYIYNHAKKNDSILDLGCGNGWLAGILAKKARVSAVDVSESNLEICKKLYGDILIEIKHGFADNLPFPDNYFNMVIMFDVVEHCFDPQKAMDDAFRVLKSKGRLIIVTPQLFGQIYENLIRNYRNTGRFFQLTRYVNYFLTGKLKGNLHFYEFTPRQIKRMLNNYSHIKIIKSPISASNSNFKKILKYILKDNFLYLKNDLFIVATK